MCPPYNRQKHNQHFKLLLFKINLHFVAPNQISTHRKLNLILINCVYLLFFTLKMQRSLVQTKVQFLLCLKRDNWQNSSCEKPLLQFVGYWYNLLQWMFFILCDSWKTLFFLKVCCYNGVFLTVTLLLSLKKLFKKIPGFYIYLQNNHTMLKPKFHSKIVVQVFPWINQQESAK